MKKAELILVCMILLGFTVVCRAEGPPAPIQTSHPVDDRLPLPDYLPEEPGRGLTLPSPPVAPGSVAGGGAFELKGVLFEGNTIFSEKELLEVTDPFLGNSVTLADLEEVRYRLTRKYVDKGYINSGAVLKPNQEVEDGVVTYLFMEGRLDGVTVTGNGRLRPGYIQKRIWPDRDTPFNVPILQERFQLLLQDPLIEKMNGRIRPGISPGEAFLDLDLERARPYALRLIADNHRTPSTGSEGVTAAGTIWNLSGFGDRLDASIGFSEGVNEVSTRFSLPLNSRGTRLSLGYNQNDNAVIEEPLDTVDIESESKNLEINLSHPLLRTLGRTLEVGVTLAARKSETSLENRSFSFSPGAVDGKSKVTALRFIQSYVDRTPVTALTLRSTLSFGLDLFDSTIHHDDPPDGKFISWLGQMQYALRLGDRFGQMIFRGDVQLANGSLLSLEQFASGGVNSVRGYRENERVRDNGYLLSAEWRYPLWERRGGRDGSLQAALFTDLGSAWNKGESSHDDPLHSVGVGLLWKVNGFVNAELYLAHDLEKAADKYEHNMQDEGIHFRVAINLFRTKG
jgi:hemolysin activation/secretion protein